MLITIALLLIGILVFCAGLYYMSQARKDAEARKIYLISALAGALIAAGAIIKLFVF